MYELLNNFGHNGLLNISLHPNNHGQLVILKSLPGGGFRTVPDGGKLLCEKEFEDSKLYVPTGNSGVNPQ